MKSKYCVLPLTTILLILAAAVPMYPQTPPSPLVTKPIDETNLVTLHGNVHPLAQATYDRGAVPDALPAERVFLLLNRPAGREMALQQFLREVHTRGSASYHRWVTPEQFGEQFGPADADIQTAVGWLQSQGFNVARVTKSKQFIEFSGTAGQFRNAFHTEIHQYDVNGETHYANASEISIPAALARLVRGVSPLNNFRATPYIKVAGRALYSRDTKRTTPLWTIPNPEGTPNPYAYSVAPEDLATQYDLTPLYQAGVNGAGQTIGIVNESNIDLSLANAYRQLFGLSSNPPQVVIDGDDPGTLSGVDTEAYLDVEVSGAIAPNATVNLYISNGSDFQDPIALSAIRAVEDNQASVLSVSFGNCELTLGNAGNQFWSGLWEQAAAQGQTALVATGDTGPWCAGIYFMAVSGIASTPWNVGVGGTDFYYSDYASGGASATTLWNQTNDSNLGSLKAPLPEQVWNDPFGLDVVSNGLQRNEIYAGGGGASNCTQTDSNGNCVSGSGYAKPSWQTGPGVPADGVRDLPDVSLFASNGANLSAYPICAYEGECAAGSGSQAEVLLTGGTSASTPAMAGIMALVNQKYGRQGQANFVLYPLSQQKSAAFHDITLGSNDSPCPEGMIDCALNANGYYATTIYSATPGYDLASGLGSVDGSVLVNNWNSITFLPTTTTLTLSSNRITHGTPVTVTTSVAPTSGSGTPSGGVAILTSSPLPSNQGEGVLTLSGGTASESIDFFPGGYYNVSAAYQGDAIFRSSASSPVALTVTPENSNINFQLSNVPNSSHVPTVVFNGGTVQYNTPLYLVIQPAGVSAPSGKTNGNATGTATFTMDTMTATVSLNAVGVASWTPPALGIGNHTASATYSGDASFNASSAKPVSFSVTQGLVLLNDNEIGPYSQPPLQYGLSMNVGSSLNVGVTAQGWNTFGAGPSQIPLGTAAPTGTVQVCLGTYPGLYNDCQNPVYSQTLTLTPVSGANAYESIGAVTFPNLAANQYYVSMVYSGDSNWGSAELLDTRPIFVQSMPPAAATTTTVSIAPSSFSGTETAVITATVTGSGDPGTAPTGPIQFFADGTGLTYYIFPSGVAGTVSSFSFEVNPSWFLNSGANQLVAVYEGGGGNGPSVSNVVNFTAVQTGADFTLAPQLPQITLQSGGSATVGLNLSSLSNFSGVVTLTCTPSSSQITCGVNPSTPMLNGTATATLTINALAQAAGLPAHLSPRSRFGWLGAGGGFVLASLVLGGFTNRKRRLAALFNLVLLAALFAPAGCGSGGGQGVQQQPPPNGTTYSVVVSATANGIIHNAKVIVVVQ